MREYTVHIEPRIDVTATRAPEAEPMGKHQLFVDVDVQDLEVGPKDVVFKVYEAGAGSDMRLVGLSH